MLDRSVALDRYAQGTRVPMGRESPWDENVRNVHGAITITGLWRALHWDIRDCCIGLLWDIHNPSPLNRWNHQGITVSHRQAMIRFVSEPYNIHKILTSISETIQMSFLNISYLFSRLFESWLSHNRFLNPLLRLSVLAYMSWWMLYLVLISVSAAISPSSQL